MSRELKLGKHEKGLDAAMEKVIVAVKAAKEVPKNALVWALTHVVQPGDSITLLVVLPSQSSGRKWGFPRFSGDCASGHRRSRPGTSSEQKVDITDSFSQMILQLHDVYDPKKINLKIKLVSGAPYGVVAEEAKRTRASWVVLDKHLRQEEKLCMGELQCNIVSVKRSRPKVLRLNLVGSPKMETEGGQLLSVLDQSSDKHFKKNIFLDSVQGQVVTPTGSSELYTATDAGTSSLSSSDPGTSPFSITMTNEELKEQFSRKENRTLDESTSESDDDDLSTSSSSLLFPPWMKHVDSSQCQSSRDMEESSHVSGYKIQTSTFKALHENFSRHEQESGIGRIRYRPDLEFSGNVREAISFSSNAPLSAPPLCSICQHRTPAFGKPPRLFSFAELELATRGFSKANFLAEGGFGSVHRGVLPNGQTVAVKQYKLASTQGDQEFCSEVEVLSCAQHRNVVMLIGFCIQDGRRLLVYEYICHGSLDSHLYGRKRDPLQWSARQKIAVGAARGLRYLHEECRVGCIVHRDMRPNNILITHDFEPLVGDFGLARWQPDGDTGVETRVIGTFGYLAPEYAQSGQITEKADVYSFGVVLVELVTGRKAVDLNRPRGQQCLTEWARPLLDEHAIDELIDPRLRNNFSEQEVYCMLHAASLCISRDPHSRPRMSQVIRILEGDALLDTSRSSTPGHDMGSGSEKMYSDHRPNQQNEQLTGRLINKEPEGFSRKLSLDAKRDKTMWSSFE
ncbi:inactive protein kinase SELMODRAFT_444075-like isoform X1 [Apium graveolens]|uniref:inactive protein kinase SELMODRAFT_444075-like isoform X1 n=1 Tax=Apium graveolens TaxID=4045 RepID=UPI003D7A467A